MSIVSQIDSTDGLPQQPTLEGNLTLSEGSDSVPNPFVNMSFDEVTYNLPTDMSGHFTVNLLKQQISITMNVLKYKFFCSYHPNNMFQVDAFLISSLLCLNSISIFLQVNFLIKLVLMILISSIHIGVYSLFLLPLTSHNQANNALIFFGWVANLNLLFIMILRWRDE